ncbi:MAG: MAPEG family protein [Kiloniellales bacterium]|jgi:uncharacterized MAPEG superfamily protein
MTTDLQMLTWTAALTAVLWLPYIGTRLAVSGIIPSLTYRDGLAPLPAWAQRAKGAHGNAVENLVPFAALVIVAHLTGTASEATAAEATAFFWARAAHAVLYVANVPFGRTIAFAIGWVAMAGIFFQIVAGAAAS